MADQRRNWTLVVKCGWLATNLSIFLMGEGSCMADPYCSVASDGLLPILYLLSFPGSTLFLVFNGLMLQLGLYFDAQPALHYVFMGLGAIGIGYLQWFRVVPALLGKQRITVLSLNQTPRSVLSEPEETTTPRWTAIESPQIRPFDSAGRTPLERVIKQK